MKVDYNICTKTFHRKMFENNIIDKKYTGVLENIPVKIIDSRFIHCEFIGVVFEKTQFNNVVFQDCIFRHCVFNGTNINYSSFLQFLNCSFFNVIFESCNMFSLHIKWSNLIKVDFTNTYMKGANFIGNSYDEVKLIDNCNLMDSIIDKTNSNMDISFINEHSYTKLNYGSYIGSFNYSLNKNNDIVNLKSKNRYLKISYSYMDFGEQFLRNHVSGKYGICFYESRIAFHRTLKGKKKIRSLLSNLICGYGEKPYRSIIVTIVMIFIFSLIYMFTGLKTPLGEIGYSYLKIDFTLNSLVITFLYSLYFSVATFSTVGYGDLVPCNIWGIFFSMVEIILGITMVGIWTSTLVRKMTR